jgi:hypothetical protein
MNFNVLEVLVCLQNDVFSRTINHHEDFYIASRQCSISAPGTHGYTASSSVYTYMSCIVMELYF